METKNTLILNKCAYLFHWSDSNFSFGKNHYETKMNIQKRLKKYYDDFDKQNEIPYYLKEGKCYINLDDLEICVNDKMIYHINGLHPRKEIINNIHFAGIENFVKNRTDCHIFTSSNLYHNSLKTLEIEEFGGNSLRYYRLHFKRNKYIFVVSGNSLYYHSDIYKEIKIKDILNALDAKNNTKARKLITDFCEFIKNN